MSFRSTVLPVIAIAVLSAGCANAEQTESAVQSDVKIDQVSFDSLIASAAVILIAKVETPPKNADAPTSHPSETAPDFTIDLKKEFDKAREETARSFTGFNVGALVGLQTIETLKGSKTDKLKIPASTQELRNAKPGQLFLIAMGTQHPDAIKKISSLDDPWAQQIRTALAK